MYCWTASNLCPFRATFHFDEISKNICRVHKESPDLLDSKATQALRLVTNRLYDIRFFSHPSSEMLWAFFLLLTQGLPGPQGAIGGPGEKVWYYIIHSIHSNTYISCETSHIFNNHLHELKAKFLILCSSKCSSHYYANKFSSPRQDLGIGDNTDTFTFWYRVVQF